MKLVRITEAQRSFLYVEVAGRYLDDEDADRAAAAVLVLEHITRGMPVTDALVDVLLDAANGIDNEIEAARKRDRRALGRIGGVETIGEARRLHQTAVRLLDKARRALSARIYGLSEQSPEERKKSLSFFVR